MQGISVRPSNEPPSLTKPIIAGRSYRIASSSLIVRIVRRVADLTCVKTFNGWVHVVFVNDIDSCRPVGWRSSTSLCSDLAVEALGMASSARDKRGLDRLIRHSDRGRTISS